MNLLTVASISKRFGDTTVLDNVSLQVATGEAAGLVGPNGVGKTTLLEVIAGNLAADSGTVTTAPNCRVGYLSQTLRFDESETIAQHINSARGDLDALEARLRALEDAMARAAPHALESMLVDYAARTTAFEERGGYARHTSAEVLAGLGLGAIDQGRRVASLSGGEKARVGLAALLLGYPDLLLLDEPTNHLDIGALEWLEAFLSTWRGGLLVVSHDRRFLDASVRSIVEIDAVAHGATTYAGNYSAFALEKAGQQARIAANYVAQQEEIRELRRIIRSKGRQVAHNRPPTDSDGFTYAFKGARVESTVARNVHAAEEKLRRIEADPMPRPPRPLVVNTAFDPAFFGSKLPLAAHELSIRLGDRLILDGVSLQVEAQTRAVIVGPNGSGKSTLLKILAGVIQPDTGRVTRAPGVIVGYLEQEQDLMEPEMTVYAHFARDQVGDWETLKTDLLTTGLFTWPEIAWRVEALSVGQKRKVQIARLLAQRANVLLLDEPTNHISLDVLEKFEQALVEFAGPIVAVSHDRRFIERFGNEIWVIEEGALRRYHGWDAYRAAYANGVPQARFAGAPDQVQLRPDAPSHPK